MNRAALVGEIEYYLDFIADLVSIVCDYVSPYKTAPNRLLTENAIVKAVLCSKFSVKLLTDGVEIAMDINACEHLWNGSSLIYYHADARTHGFGNVESFVVQYEPNSFHYLEFRQCPSSTHPRRYGRSVIFVVHAREMATLWSEVRTQFDNLFRFQENYFEDFQATLSE